MNRIFYILHYKSYLEEIHNTLINFNELQMHAFELWKQIGQKITDNNILVNVYILFGKSLPNIDTFLLDICCDQVQVKK